MKPIKLAAVAAALFILGGCTTGAVQKIQTWSTNYQAAIVSINADIAASAPAVFKVCGDIQTVAGLIAPFIPNSGKAQQYFNAANGALSGYCQVVPTDINSAVASLGAAYKSAVAGYNQVKAGG